MSRLNEHTLICCDALDFIAESANIYNWNLLRNPNPQFIMYDVTSKTKNDLFETIMTNVNNPYIIKMLKLTLKSLHIIVDSDGYDFGALAAFFATYIQERQKKLHDTGNYIEVETLLTSEIHNISICKPELYLEFYEMEKHHIELNLNHNMTTRSNLYNNIDYHAYNEINNFINYLKPTIEDGEESFDEIELEILYYNEDDENDTIININYILKKIKVEGFECPICYNVQKSEDLCVTLNCRHKYCKTCFHAILDSKTIACAMCRSPITECEESEII